MLPCPLHFLYRFSPYTIAISLPLILFMAFGLMKNKNLNHER